LLDAIENTDEIQSDEDINLIFIERVKYNLHFVLSFNPVGDSFG
jgi:hypothetical protein